MGKDRANWPGWVPDRFRAGSEEESRVEALGRPPSIFFGLRSGIAKAPFSKTWFRENDLWPKTWRAQARKMAAAAPSREPKTDNSLIDVSGWGFCPLALEPGPPRAAGAPPPRRPRDRGRRPRTAAAGRAAANRRRGRSSRGSPVAAARCLPSPRAGLGEGDGPRAGPATQTSNALNKNQGGGFSLFSAPGGPRRAPGPQKKRPRTKSRSRGRSPDLWGPTSGKNPGVRSQSAARREGWGQGGGRAS